MPMFSMPDWWCCCHVVPRAPTIIAASHAVLPEASNEQHSHAVQGGVHGVASESHAGGSRLGDTSSATKSWKTLSVPTTPLLPYSKSHQTTAGSLPSLDPDGGTGSDPGGRRMGRIPTMDAMRSRPLGRRTGRLNSQLNFGERNQSFVVFDWDDTLFPTSYIQQDLQLDWSLPLSQQDICSSARDMVTAKLALCEQRAMRVMERATTLAHVVVVTLALSNWVEMACEHFYPQMGKLMKSLDVQVVYAQERCIKQSEYHRSDFQSNEEMEMFWGGVKGQAIAEEVGKFYSRYQGQSWKNILSFGDAPFERYGLLAAASAYMQGGKIGDANTTVWNPTQEGLWQKTSENGKMLKVRAKCVKFVDFPDIDELTVELEMALQWLEPMVKLDSGFDLDLAILEDESKVELVEAVLAGAKPASALTNSEKAGS